MTLSPNKIGYRGQKFRIVVDERAADGSVSVRRIGWSDGKGPEFLEACNARPSWSNARYEEVTDSDAEGKPPAPTKAE